MNRTRLRLMCHIALLVALQIVLERFVSINTLGYKIGFGFVPTALCAMIYGPVPAAITCAMSDFLGAMLFPFGPYHPGFTICAAVMGFVYGIFLHRRDKTNKKYFFVNMLLAALLNNLLLGLLINTIWVAQLYDSRNYWGWFLYRVPQYAILIPVNLVLLPALRKSVDKLSQYCKLPLLN